MSDRFDEILKDNICWQISKRKEVNFIKTQTECLSDLVESKLLMHFYNRNFRTPNNKANIRRVLQYNTALLYSLFEGKVNFRTALFLLSDDQTYLMPFILDNTNKTKWNFLNNNNINKELCASFFSIDGDSVAARSWIKNCVIIKNESINTVKPIDSSHLQSILCYPLELIDEVYDILKEHNPYLNEVIGVLCVDCDDKNVFSVESHRLMEQMVKPFADRILYEFSLGLYYYYKEKNIG